MTNLYGVIMRKTLLALAASAVIVGGTIASPTRSEAHPAAIVVVAIVAAAVIGTVVVAHALTPTKDIQIYPHRHHRHHR